MTAGMKITGHDYVREKYVERKIHFLFVQEVTVRTREDMINENFFPVCIYDILKDRRRPREEIPILNHLKAKIARVHSKQFQ